MYPVDSQYLEYLSLVQPGRLQYSEYIAFSANLDGSGEASCRRQGLHRDLFIPLRTLLLLVIPQGIGLFRPWGRIC